MHDPIAVLLALGGIAYGSRLQQYGFTRDALSALVRAGTLTRLRMGVYALATVDRDIRTAAAHGGMVTCSSALRRMGVWMLTEGDALHVWMGEKGRVHRHPDCHCVTHFGRGDGEGFGVVPIETALVQLQRCAGDEAFFVALESALNQRLLTRASRARILEGLPISAQWLIGFARSDAQSGLESLLRLRMHILGISLQSQVAIPGVGRVDFVVAGRLIIEVDGYAFHGDKTGWHRDRTRDAVASAMGYETLHFDYAQVVHDWPQVQAAILAPITRAHDYA
ncbi:MAG: DUF559 domain-containing protein [Microbacterium sp.]